MNNTLIAEFFDRLATDWDSNMEDVSSIISRILDSMEPLEMMDILDVGAVTGVLVLCLLKKEVASITESDLSHGMLEENRSKFGKDSRVHYAEGDASTTQFGRRFDCIIIYNAFPHFTDREKLMENLSFHLKKDGLLVIAHSRSSKDLDRHHHSISTELYKDGTKAEEVAKLLAKDFRDIRYQDEPNFLVAGKLC